MRGTKAKNIRWHAKLWMQRDLRITNFRQACQTLKKHYKAKKSGKEILV